MQSFENREMGFKISLFMYRAFKSGKNGIG
jgi:hypothetical protein